MFNLCAVNDLLSPVSTPRLCADKFVDNSSCLVLLVSLHLIVLESVSATLSKGIVSHSPGMLFNTSALRTGPCGVLGTNISGFVKLVCSCPPSSKFTVP